MKSNYSLLGTTIGLLAVASLLNNTDAATPAGNDPVAIVQSACRDAAKVGRVVPPGQTGRTVIVLEETHDSLAVQLELAAVLVRLHTAGLTDLVLEGYLKDDLTGVPLKSVSRDWFRKSAGSLPSDVQRETAARLLKEGEISAAEFFFLAYDDVRLLPAETLAVHSSHYSDKHAEAVFKAIGGIADAVLKAAAAGNRIDVAKFNQLATRLQNATSDEAKKETVQSLMNYVATLDPWLKSAYPVLTNPDFAADAALTQQAQVHGELTAQARKWKVDVDPKLLDEAALFFTNRAEADKIMVASAVGTKSRLLALNVGALHTAETVKLLAAQGLGVIVVTPLSLKDKTGKLADSQFERKQQKQSAFDAGQIARLLKMLPTVQAPSKKKQEPSITEPWCKAKGELYNFISRLTRQILGPPNPPGGGQPPYGFDDGAFRGDFFFIDPRRVRYLDAERAIIFPIATKDDPTKAVIWVKSTKSEMEGVPASALAQSGIALSAAADAERLVSILLAQRDIVNARQEAPTSAADRTAAGGTLDIIQVDLKTLAAIGFDERAVAAAVVSTR